MKPVELEEALKSVGPGWGLLIRGLYACKPDNVTVVQVKEKFGWLRFYTGECSEEYGRCISQAEYLSGYVCEFCGEPGMRQSLPSGMWTKTICARCWADRRKEREQENENGVD